MEPTHEQIQAAIRNKWKLDKRAYRAKKKQEDTTR
jgi:HD-like signal output (HDOD) protein